MFSISLTQLVLYCAPPPPPIGGGAWLKHEMALQLAEIVLRLAKIPLTQQQLARSI